MKGNIGTSITHNFLNDIQDSQAGDIDFETKEKQEEIALDATGAVFSGKYRLPTKSITRQCLKGSLLQLLWKR